MSHILRLCSRSWCLILKPQKTHDMQIHLVSCSLFLNTRIAFLVVLVFFYLRQSFFVSELGNRGGLPNFRPPVDGFDAVPHRSPSKRSQGHLGPQTSGRRKVSQCTNTIRAPSFAFFLKPLLPTSFFINNSCKPTVSAYLHLSCGKHLREHRILCLC